MIYNVDFDIIAVVISFFSMILAFTKKDFWKRQNFILFVLLVTTFFTSLLDIFSSVGNSYIVEWSYGLRDVLNYGYLAVQNVMPYLFCLYIVFLIDLDHKMAPKRRRLFYICLSFPYAVDAILLCLNPFIREVFYYDPNRVYTHGWGMIVLYVNALLYMISDYYLMSRYGKNLRFSKKATVYLFLTASLTAIVFQMIFPTILLQLSVEALCLSGILFTIENENEILHSILLYTFLLLFSIFAEVDIIPDVFPIRMLDSVYFLVLGILLVQYFSERIADRGRLRQWMLCSTWLMVLFMVFRMLKLEVFPVDSVMYRYVWYFYYLPVLSISLCTFYATLWIDGEEKNRRPAVIWGAGAITLFIFLFVLTNDLHQTVFVFRDGILNCNKEYYTYGFGYYAVMAWAGVLYIAAIVNMLKKCRLSGVRKSWEVILIPFVIGIALQLLIAFDKIPKINGLPVIHFAESVCFVIALFWECCIRLGLIPSNKGYGELMRVSSLAMQITDISGETIYKSISARELDDIPKNKTQAVLLDDDTELYCETIPGGYVYWQNDISELNEVNRKLEEVHSLLAEETELIRLENELKERRTSIEQRTQLYELINKKTIIQSGKISGLAQGALQSDDEQVRNYNAGVICFLGAYIKRYANLQLLAENEDRLSCAELGMAIAEPLRYLTNIGIPTDYAVEGNAKIPTQKAILLYETFEKLIEDHLEYLKAVYVKLDHSEKVVLKIVLEGVIAALDENLLEKLSRAEIEPAVEVEDEVSYFSFRMIGEV